MSSMRGANTRGRGRGNAFNAQPNTSFRGASSSRGRVFNNAPRSRGTPTGRGAQGQAVRGNGAHSTRAGGGFMRGSSSFQQHTPARKPGATGAMSSGSWQERQEQLQKYRDQEKKQAIAQGLMSDPDKQIGLSEAITIVGTCQDMCPENERVLRTVRNEVWAEEKGLTQGESAGQTEPDEARMVKAFRRSAAGDEVQLPSDLRPPTVLKRTCDYLFTDVVGNAPALGKIHHFVWDRTRAIRNDFSIQQLTKLDDLRIAIDCYERIARFHIVSLHELAGPDKPYGKYDPQQEREQLDRTLLSLMQYYDDTRGRLELHNEAEFRAYCVILQLRDPTPDLEDRIQSWPSSIAADYRVRSAIEVYTAACSTIWPEGPIDKTQHVIARQDWDKFWKLVESKKVSFLLACVAETHFMMIREMALSAIIRSSRVTRKNAHGPAEPNTEWTADDLDRLLHFDTDEDMDEFCGRWNLHFETREEDGKDYLDIRHLAGKPLPKGDAAKSTQVKSSLVEAKRHGRTLPAVINGLTVRQARDAGMVIEEEEFQEEEMGYEESSTNGNDLAKEVDMEEEDENSLFIPEKKPSDEEQDKLATGLTAADTTSKTGFGVASSPFSQPSTSSPFAQPSGTGFGRPSTGFNFKPSEPDNSNAAQQKSPFNFLSNGDAASKPTTASPFATAKPLEPPAEADSKSTSATATTGIFGDFESRKPANSPFGQSDTTPNPFAFLGKSTTEEQPKPPPQLGGSIINWSTPASSEKSSQPAPSFSDAGAISKPDQPALAPSEKPSFQFGQTNGAPSVQSQSETNLKSASQTPSQPATTQQAPPTSQNATVSSNSGSQSPPRRPSATSWEAHKTKKPSPLSHSFSATDDSANGQPLSHQHSALTPAKSPPRELFPSKQTAAAPPSQLKPAGLSAAASAPEDHLGNLAAHLTYDQENGFLRQYLDFAIKQAIVDAQETVFYEKCRLKCRALEERRLIREYGVWWRNFARHRRLAAKSRQRRERTRERLRRSTAENSVDGSSDTDSVSSRQLVLPSAARNWHDRKDVVDALYRSVSGDKQATPGRKRTVSASARNSTIGKELAHKRQKSMSHVSERGRVSKAAPTSHPDDNLLKRSSFLGFSTASNDTNRTSTTKSTYFRLKALGIQPDHSSSIAAPRGTKRQRSESFDLDKALASTNRSPPSRALTSEQQRDKESMPPPATRSKTNDEDEALFARLRAAREALQEGESIMKDELRRSMSGSLSSNDSPSMDKARTEAKMRMSYGQSDSVPAYQLRESRFVPREEYGLARERAMERRASRSRDNSRSVSRADDREADTLTSTKPMEAAVKKPGLVSAKDSTGIGNAPSVTKLNGGNGGVEGSGQDTTDKSRPFAGFGATSAFTPTSINADNSYISGCQTSVPPSLTSNSTVRNPFLQSSSFAPPRTNGQNPFLQNVAQSSMNQVTGVQNDHTVPPSQINLSLAHTFGRPSAAPTTTHGSPTPPQTNSYMPSQAASERVSLLSDDEGDVDQAGEGFVQYDVYAQSASGYVPEEPYAPGQAEFYQRMRGTFEDGKEFDTESYGQDNSAYMHGMSQYANNPYGALANHDDTEEDEQGGQLDSYQNSDESEGDEEPDDDSEDEAHGGQTPNGHYDDEPEEYGDDEDEGDSDDEEQEDYEEEDDDGEEEAPPPTYRYPKPNAALQVVGNSAEEAIELSD